MGNLIVTCMQVYDKRTCGVIRPTLKECAGCEWSRIGKKIKAELKPEPLKPLPYVHPLEKGGN